MSFPSVAALGSGLHGLALGDEVTEVDGRLCSRDSQVWVELALNWLRRHIGRAA